MKLDSLQFAVNHIWTLWTKLNPT